MNVSVHYTAHLKKVAGRVTQALVVEEGATLSACFTKICDTAPAELRALLVDEQQHLRPAILLCVNDQQRPLDDPAPLSEGAEITLLAAISGG